MRDLLSLATPLGTDLGTEPLIVIEIDWDEINTTRYCDRDYESASGKILQINPLTSKSTVDGVSVAEEITFQLDDSDGLIKDFLEGDDYRVKCPARIYLTFGSLSYSQKELLLSGQVQLPVTWLEGGRTVEITVNNTIESEEVGFSVDEEDSSGFPKSSVDAMWPICYGKPTLVEALQVSDQPIGTMLSDFSVITYGELNALEQLCNKEAEAKYKKVDSDNTIAQLYWVVNDAYYNDVVQSLSAAKISVQVEIEKLASQNESQRDNLHKFAEACVQRTYYRTMEIIYTELANYVFDAIATDIAAEIQAIDNAISALSSRFVAVSGVIISYLNAQRAEFQSVFNTIGTVIDNYRDHATYYGGLANDQQVIVDATAEEITSSFPESFEIEQDYYTSADGQLEIIVNKIRFLGSFESDNQTFTLDPVGPILPTYENLTLGTRQPSSSYSDVPNQFWLADTETANLRGMYLLMVVDGGSSELPFKRIVHVVNQIGKQCIITPVLWNTGSNTVDEEGNIAAFEEIFLDANNASILAAAPTVLPSWSGQLDDSKKPFQLGLTQIPETDWEVKRNQIVYFGVEHSSEKYVVHDGAANGIAEVLAYRNIDGDRRLVAVPSSYYTVNTSDTVRGRTVTTVTLNQPLETYLNEGWSKGIYVSVDSGNPDNAADVINDLINTWSSTLSVDSTSLTIVSGKVLKYPVNFVLTAKRDLLDLCKDIAKQARIALRIKGSTVYMQYLGAEPDYAFQFDTSTILGKSLRVSSVSPFEMETKQVGIWNVDNHGSEEKRLVIKNNHTIYGIRESSYNFWIYDIESLVAKSLTHWNILKSNVWRLVDFEAPLAAAEVEALDRIRIQCSDIDPADVDGFVLESSIDFSSYKIRIQAMINVKVGYNTVHPIGLWPGDSNSTFNYPTNQETDFESYVWDTKPSDNDDSTPTLIPYNTRSEKDYKIPVNANIFEVQGQAGNSSELRGRALRDGYNEDRDDFVDINLYKTNIIDESLSESEPLTSTLATLFRIRNDQHLAIDASELLFYHADGDGGSGAFGLMPTLWDQAAYIVRPHAVFPVKVVQVGGSGGNATTQASWTYDCYEWLGSGDRIAVAQTPEWPRPAVGVVTKAPNNSVGFAMMMPDGTFRLIAVGEVEEVEACP